MAIASIMFAFTGYGFIFALTAIVPPALMALLAQRWLERGLTFGPV